MDQWFCYWMDNLSCDLSPNTKRNYQKRYRYNIQPVLGSMKLSDVKSMHCKAVLNRMETTYAGSTIRQAYITMGTLLRAAVNNNIIFKHSMDGVRYTKPVRAVVDIRFLTVEERKKFLKAASCSYNYRQFVLLLETRLRTSELVGLTGDSIDWKRRTLTVNKTLEYRYSTQRWRAGPPKTEKSYRTIPLTSRAYAILESCYAARSVRKESEILSQIFEYLDLRSGQKKYLVMRDLVFLNFRTGEPMKNSAYDTHLYKLCDKAGIRHFGMHALRHTYATRAIESGMSPKFCKSCWGTPALKQLWTATSTSSMIPWWKASASLNPAPILVKKWCGNGAEGQAKDEKIAEIKEI